MKKIAFSDRYGLTQAVLEGRKTMTRRIATALNHPNITDISEWGVDNKGKAMLAITYDTGLQEDVYPHFQIGEIVAVAQRYSQIMTFNPSVLSKERLSCYGVGVEACKYLRGWNNKMFVRADLMPHRIRITNIKLERLQDIGEDDCLREGILQSVDGMDIYTFDGWVKRNKGGIPVQVYSQNRREAFASLIDRISGRGTWERNPWVFAYEFELIK